MARVSYEQNAELAYQKGLQSQKADNYMVYNNSSDYDDEKYKDYHTSASFFGMNDFSSQNSNTVQSNLLTRNVPKKLQGDNSSLLSKSSNQRYPTEPKGIEILRPTETNNGYGSYGSNGSRGQPLQQPQQPQYLPYNQDNQNKQNNQNNPDRTNISALSIGQLNRNCPICGKPTISICNCISKDSTCVNGHRWHFDDTNNSLVLGHYEH